MAKSVFFGFLNKRKKARDLKADPLPPELENTEQIWKKIINNKENASLFNTWLNLAVTQAETALLTDLAEMLKSLKNLTAEQKKDCVQDFFNKKIERKNDNISNFEEALLEKNGELKNFQSTEKEFRPEPFVYKDDKGNEKNEKDLANEFIKSGEELVQTLKKVSDALSASEEALVALKEGMNEISPLIKLEATQRISFRKIDDDTSEYASRSSSSRSSPR